jgi:hypothetical protein
VLHGLAVHAHWPHLAIKELDQLLVLVLLQAIDELDERTLLGIGHDVQNRSKHRYEQRKQRQQATMKQQEREKAGNSSKKNCSSTKSPCFFPSSQHTPHYQHIATTLPAHYQHITSTMVKCTTATSVDEDSFSIALDAPPEIFQEITSLIATRNHDAVPAFLRVCHSPTTTGSKSSRVQCLDANVSVM